MRSKAFTLWTNLPGWERGDMHQGESGYCAIRGVTLLYRVLRPIVGSTHTLMVPFKAVAGSYSPARRGD